MHSDLLKKFAAELKNAREEKQISLSHISAKTRIDLKYLTAIDNANFEVLPDLYIRAFIKEYALSIDLNPEETIKKFDLAKAGKSDSPEEAAPVDSLSAEKKKRSTRTIQKQFESDDLQPAINADEIKRSLNPKILYAVIGAASILLIIGIYLIFGVSDSIEKDTSVQKQEIAGDINRYEEKAPSEIYTPSSNDSLQLKIAASDLVWFEVACDANPKQQFMFKDRQSVELKAKEKFIMNIGNAGGLKLTLNGKLLDPVGKPGDVKYVQIDRNGIKFLTLERPKNEQSPAKGN